MQAEIPRLEQQRRTIAQLKAAQVGADVPPAFADFLALLSREALPTHLLQMEINGFLSAAHALNDQELQEVIAFYKSSSSTVYCPNTAVFVIVFTEGDKSIGAVRVTPSLPI